MGELREIRESRLLVTTGWGLWGRMRLGSKDTAEHCFGSAVAPIGVHFDVTINKVLDLLGDLGLGSTLDGHLDVLAGIHKVLLLSGDLVAAHVDTLAGAVGGILGCDVELESFFLGLTSELDALSPEEVSLLGIFAFVATPSPHLAVKPAVARLVSGEAADAALEALEGVQDRADALHPPAFFLVGTGEELFGFHGLALLTLNDLVYGEDDGLFVLSFFFEHVELLFADPFILEVFRHPLHAHHEVEKLVVAKIFDRIGGFHGVRIGGLRKVV